MLFFVIECKSSSLFGKNGEIFDLFEKLKSYLLLVEDLYFSILLMEGHCEPWLQDLMMMVRFFKQH